MEVREGWLLLYYPQEFLKHSSTSILFASHFSFIINLFIFFTSDHLCYKWKKKSLQSYCLKEVLNKVVLLHRQKDDSCITNSLRFPKIAVKKLLGFSSCPCNVGSLLKHEDSEWLPGWICCSVATKDVLYVHLQAVPIRIQFFTLQLFLVLAFISLNHSIIEWFVLKGTLKAI